jgi:hypothetical protein
VVGAAGASGDLAGSGELEDLRYYPLEDALQLELALVTRRVLEQLQAYLALSDAERRGRDRTPLLRQRAWHME